MLVFNFKVIPNASMQGSVGIIVIQHKSSADGRNAIKIKTKYYFRNPVLL